MQDVIFSQCQRIFVDCTLPHPAQTPAASWTDDNNLMSRLELVFSVIKRFPFLFGELFSFCEKNCDPRVRTQAIYYPSYLLLFTNSKLLNANSHALLINSLRERLLCKDNCSNFAFISWLILIVIVTNFPL